MVVIEKNAKRAVGRCGGALGDQGKTGAVLLALLALPSGPSKDPIGCVVHRCCQEPTRGTLLGLVSPDGDQNKPQAQPEQKTGTEKRH